jgi:hypothetical protein
MNGIVFDRLIQNIENVIFGMVIGSSTVVQHSATHPEIMGLNPATEEYGVRNKEKWYIG